MKSDETAVAHLARRTPSWDTALLALIRVKRTDGSSGSFTRFVGHQLERRLPQLIPYHRRPLALLVRLKLAAGYHCFTPQRPRRR